MAKEIKKTSKKEETPEKEAVLIETIPTSGVVLVDPEEERKAILERAKEQAGG